MDQFLITVMTLMLAALVGKVLFNSFAKLNQGCTNMNTVVKPDVEKVKTNHYRVYYRGKIYEVFGAECEPKWFVKYLNDTAMTTESLEDAVAWLAVNA